jgi:hypothetical protein
LIITANEICVHAGVGSPLFTIPLVNAIVFASYEQCKQFITRKNPDQQLSETQLAVCGGFSGLVACSIVSPVELIRSLQQVCPFFLTDWLFFVITLFDFIFIAYKLVVVVVVIVVSIYLYLLVSPSL